MIKLGTLFWEMAVENADFQRDLKQSDADVEKFAGNVDRHLNKAKLAFAGIGIAAGAMVAVAAKKLIDFSKDAVDLGSAAEEAGSKFDTVFGPAARGVEEDLTKFAKAAQRSKYDLKEMASSVQDTFVPLGFARDKAAELSTELTKLAVDVGSFNNAADTDVMAAFQSAVVGNHEAVRKYGILLTEATLNQELYSMGIEGGIRSATELEKVQARLNLLFKGSSDAQGDAVRTSDSWANMTRGLTSVLRDLQTQIGERLIPELQPFLEILKDFAVDVAPLVETAVVKILEVLRPLVTQLARLAGDLEDASAAAANAARNSIEEMDAAQRRSESGWSNFVTNIRVMARAVWELLSQTVESLVGFLVSVDDALDVLSSGGSLADAVNVISVSMDTMRERSNAWLDTFLDRMPEVSQVAQAMGVDTYTALGMVAEGFSITEARAEEYWAGWGQQMEDWVTSTRDAGEGVVAGMEDTADGIESVVQRIIDAMNGERVFGPMAEEAGQYYENLASNTAEYLDAVYQAEIAYAEARTQINLQLQQDLAAVDAEYEGLRADLVARGENAQLDILEQAYNLKRTGIINQANKELQIQAASYKNQITNAKTKEKEIIRILEIGAKTTVGMISTMSRQQAMAAIISYGDMAAAATGWAAATVAAVERAEQAMLQGKFDDPTAYITSIYNSAVQSIQAQAQASAEAAGAAIDSITADFETGIDASLNLADALGDVDTSLGAIGSTGRPGGNIKPQVIDPLEEAASIVEKLGKMIQSAIDAFDALTDWGAPADGWQDAFGALLDALEVMVTDYAETVARLKNSGIFEPEQYDVLVKATGMIDKVMGLFSNTAETVNQLDVDAFADVTDQADELANDMIVLTRELDRAISALVDGADGMDIDELAKTADKISGLLAPWVAAAQTMLAIAGTTRMQIGPAAEQLFLQLQGLIFKFRRFGDLIDDDLLTEVAELADRVVLALKPYDAASKTVDAIAGAAGQRIDPAAERLFVQLQGLIWKLRRFGDMVDDNLLTEVSELADRIVQALKPYDAASKTMASIVDGTAQRVGPAAEHLFMQLQNLIWKLRRFGDLIDDDLLAEVSELADRIVQALKPYETAGKTMASIVEATTIRVGPAAERLFGQFQNLIWKLRRFGDLVPPELLDEVAELAPKIVAALSPYTAAANTVEAISYSTSQAIGPAAERLFGQFQNLIWKLRRFDDLVPPELLNEIAELAPKIVAALSPYAAAVTTINAITHVSSQNIDDKASVILETMIHIVGLLAGMVDNETEANLVRAAQLARYFEDAMRPWDRAIRLAEDMRSWRYMPDLEEKFIAFGQQWINIVAALAAAVVTLSNEGMAAVGQFSDVLEALISGLQGAMDLALAMPAQWTDPDWRPFIDWVQNVFVTFYDWINQWGSSEPGGPIIPIFSDEGLDIVGHFAGVLNSLMTALSAALTLALALPAEWTEPDWVPFVGWVQNVFMTVYDWLMEWTSSEPGGPAVPRFDDGDLDVVGAFGSALQSLFAGLQAALEFALLLPAEWTEPPSWQPFIEWVQRAFDLIMAWIDTYLPEDPDEAVDFEAVRAFGDALGAVFGGLKAALELALALPAEWTEPPSWQPFIEWVQDAFDIFIAYVDDHLPEDPEEATIFEPVQAFGDALGAVFGGLQAVIAFSLALPGTWQAPSQETWQALIGWVEGAMDAFIAYVEQHLPETPEEASIFEPVQAFGDALSAVFNGLVSALELFLGLQAWVGPGSDFQIVLTAFLDQVLAAMQHISDYVNAHLTTEQIAAVADFGGALSALVGGLSAGLQLFRTLADTDPTVYTESHVFEQRVANLLQAISGTLAAFQAWIQNNSNTAWTEPAQDFYDAVNTVFGLLRDGLQLFVDLQASGLPPTSLIQAFIDTLLGVFSSFATSLANMAAPAGVIDLAVGAIESMLSNFPTSLTSVYSAWQTAGGALGASVATGLLDSVGTVGDPGSAGTIWGALGHISWTLDQWEPGTTMEGEYWQHGADLAGQLVAGMLSETGEMWNAGYALAQSGLDGFDAGAGLAANMANMANTAAHAANMAAPEWIMQALENGGDLSVNITHTHRFETAGGRPGGVDLSPKTINAIAAAMRDKVGRGG